MSFPKKSQAYQAVGKPGTRATDNPVIYVAGQTVAGEDGVTAGLFAWGTPSSETNDIYKPVLFSNTGTGKPAGIVSAETIQTYLDIDEEASMHIPANTNALIISHGDIFVKTETAATVGQKVFAVLADGTIKTGDAGAVIDGAVETNAKVVTAGAAGDVIIISNY